MTEDKLRQAVVSRAVSLLGLNEADGSFMPILEAYNAIRPLPRGYRMRRENPWCAAFVSAVGAMCSLSGVLLPECSCERMIDKYRALGRFLDRDDAVRPGDLVFYDWDGDGAADHVGLVETADADALRVIEGNHSDAVGRRRLPWDAACILGYAVPDYAAAAGEPEDAPASDGALRLPALRRGDRGLCVRAMQGVLIARGCGCGPDGADGDFGPNTEAALRRFQAEAGLPPDGVCGPASWKKLLGVEA